MRLLTSKPKAAASELASSGLHALTIAILGLLSLAGALHVALALA